MRRLFRAVRRPSTILTYGYDETTKSRFKVLEALYDESKAIPTKNVQSVVIANILGIDEATVMDVLSYYEGKELVKIVPHKPSGATFHLISITTKGIDEVEKAGKETPTDRTVTITITGDGNVVGKNNQVVTNIHKELDTDEFRELGKAFALLRGEIIQNNSIPEKAKNQAYRAIQDSEEEVADNDHRNLQTIVSGLRRAKDLIEASGHNYDGRVGWGKRLTDVIKILMKIFPAIVPLISSLVGSAN
jgi:DNA-binding MarR family transcriptional regulator